MAYTSQVPQDMPSAVITIGFIFQILGVVAAYQYVTSGSASAAFVWIPAGTGFGITLVGVVIWCRRNMNRLRSLAGWLFLIGGLTFCVAALGHAIGVFFLIAIPTLLLSAGVAVWAAGAAILKRASGHRHSHPT